MSDEVTATVEIEGITSTVTVECGDTYTECGAALEAVRLALLGASFPADWVNEHIVDD